MCRIPTPQELQKKINNFFRPKANTPTKGTTDPPPAEDKTEPETEIEEPAAEEATKVTKKYARRGRKANVLAGAMGGMNMENIRRRRMLGSFSEPMGQY